MIGIVNHSTRVNASYLAVMAWACNYQIAMDVAPAWGMIPRPVKVFQTDLAAAKAGAWIIAILDNSDQAGALGYHSLTPKGFPYGRVFCSPVLDNGGTMLEGENSICAVLSHECGETFVDPDCNFYGSDWALEIGDAVEADSYIIMVGKTPASVSNFCYRPWWNPEAPTGSRFDYMKKLTAPFQMTPGGYGIKLVNGSPTQITARTGSPTLARHNPEFPASRTFKRLNA